MTIMTHTDTAADDMYPERAEEINKLSKPVDGVYYFSYSYQTTRKTLAGTQVPKIKTLVVLRRQPLFSAHTRRTCSPTTR